MQQLTGEIFTLKKVFIRNLETKFTSSVNSLTLNDHFPTVDLSFDLAFLSWLLRSCYSLLPIKRKLSDYLHIKMVFTDFQGLYERNFCREVNPYITVTQPFPKGDGVMYSFDLLNFGLDHLGSNIGIISGPGSFAVQFGDYLRSGIICSPGIICGPVQHHVTIGFSCERCNFWLNGELNWQLGKSSSGEHCFACGNGISSRIPGTRGSTSMVFTTDVKEET